MELFLLVCTECGIDFARAKGERDQASPTYSPHGLAAPRLKLCSRQLRRLPFVLLLVFVVIIIFFVFFARSDLSSYVCVLLMLVC